MAATALAAAFTKPRRAAGAVAHMDLEKLFPLEFGRWRTAGNSNAFVRPANEPIYRIYEQVLERTFIDDQGRDVMLSVAYGSNQLNGLELHLPEVCYRYGGFAVRDARPDVVRAANGRSLPVTRLVAEMPGRPEAVTYWIVIGGTLVADAYSRRLTQLSFAVQRLIVDGLLVRVSSVDADLAHAFALHDAFIVDLVRSLAPNERAAVVGTAYTAMV